MLSDRVCGCSESTGVVHSPNGVHPRAMYLYIMCGAATLVISRSSRCLKITAMFF